MKNPKIGILQADYIEHEMKSVYGDFDHMFQEILFPQEKKNDILQCETFHIYRDSFPLESELEQYELFIITGSRWGVYDSWRWLSRLNKLILKIIDRKIALLGICFGHQAIAHALGGVVNKYEKGWHLGLQEYQNLNSNVMTNQSFFIPTIHQDQVIERPKKSILIAESIFCRNAALLYPKLRTISFQGHIEYPLSYFQWVLRKYSNDLYSDELADQAVKTIENKASDGRQIALNALEWLAN